MTTSVKARFTNGALTPLEPLELEEGAEVTLRIVNVAPNKLDTPALGQTGEKRAPGSGTHPTLAMIDRLRAEISELKQEKAPPDGAKNYKHYLYGFPREND